MSKFTDDTKLCLRDRKPAGITELQEDTNKLVEWRMNFIADKCSLMHIGHNNMQGNYNMSSKQLTITDQQRVWKSSSPKTSSGKNKQKSCKRPTEYWGSLPAISGTKTKKLYSHYTNP